MLFDSEKEYIRKLEREIVEMELKSKHREDMKDYIAKINDYFSENRKVIAFYGRQGSGKDSMADEFMTLFPNVVKLSFAKPLKDELNSIVFDMAMSKDAQVLAVKYNTTITNIKDLYEIVKDDISIKFDSHTMRSPGIRRALQFWGTDVRRHQDKRYWLSKVNKLVKDELIKGNYVIITDARFVNELQFVEEIGGVLVHLDVPVQEIIRRIQLRDGITPSEEALNHVSDIDHLNYTGQRITISDYSASLLDNFKSFVDKLEVFGE